jgi:hypothetical protein
MEWPSQESEKREDAVGSELVVERRAAPITSMARLHVMLSP